jgi:hypothetical protein
MSRATIIVEVGEPEQAVVDAWLPEPSIAEDPLQRRSGRDGR